MTDHKIVCLFFFKQKTAYEMRISDWSSDVCSSDLYFRLTADRRLLFGAGASYSATTPVGLDGWLERRIRRVFPALAGVAIEHAWGGLIGITHNRIPDLGRIAPNVLYAQGFSGQGLALTGLAGRSEEHPSELQSLLRISYAVFCL